MSANKLHESDTSSKVYWLIIKTLVNEKKLPVILPIIVNNKLLTILRISQISSMISSVNNVKLYQTIAPSYQFRLLKLLSTVDIDLKKILKLIQSLNSNKTYGHDGISIRVLKLCGPSIIKPLFLLFSNCLRDGDFPNHWKTLFQCRKK